MNYEYGTYINKGYARELRAMGKRKKSRAFLEYQIDMEDGELNSVGFYAKSWETSKSTAHSWIKEFSEKIELFFNYWELKNKQQYNYVKNTAERQPNDSRTIKHSIQPYYKEFERECETVAERQPNKEETYTTTNKTFASDGEFNIFYSECKFINGKYIGSKKSVYKSYLSIYEVIKPNILLKSYRSYIADGNDKTVGIVKFINEMYYLPYLPNKIIVKSKDGNIFSGEYKKSDEVLILESGERANLTNAVYIDKLKNKEIEFIV